MMRSTVTLSLPRKRLNRTSSARSPLESRRRHTSLPATMRPTSAAPLYRDDDPRTGPTSSLSVTTSRHPCPNRSAAIGITCIADSGILYLRPESFCRTRCVHPLALLRGEGWGEGLFPRKREGWTRGGPPHPPRKRAATSPRRRGEVKKSSPPCLECHPHREARQHRAHQIALQ